MIALTFRYERTVYTRISTCGGMDSDPGPQVIEETTLTVVVPRDDEFWVLAARAWVERYSGNNRDKAFRYTAPIVKTPINGILSTVRLAD